MALIATAVSFTTLFCAYHLFLKNLINQISPCYGISVYSTCIPKGYSVYGIDISHHQGDIDWKTLHSKNNNDTPISFVYIKATEGSDHKDTRFEDNWNGARQGNLMRGAYHYFSTTSTGIEQARMFIGTVQMENGDLPPMVDVEEIPENEELFKEELKIFIAKIEEHYGARPIIYSGKKYKKRYLTDKFFDKYPTWIAHYYVDSLDVEGKWCIWQCTDKGRIPGIKRKIDINIFNGDLQQLKELCIK